MTKMTKISILLSSLYISHPFAVNANDIFELSLEDLLNIDIGSASKFSQKINQAPSAVKVITSQQIEHFGWRTLDQALASLPSMFSFNDGSYSYLGARGLMVPGDYNTRVLLLIDGVPWNDSIYGTATLGSDFPLDLSLIDRIEYVPGPGSAIYGANAMFGVINIFTKSANDKSYNGEFVVDTDNHHRSTVRTNFMHQFDNGASMLVAAKKMHKSDKDKTFPGATDLGLSDGSGNPITSNTVYGRDEEDDKELFAKFQWKDLTLSLVHGNRTNEPANPLYYTDFNGDLTNKDQFTFLTAVYDKQLSNGNNWYNSINYQNVDFEGYFPYESVVNVDDTSSQRWLAESRLTMTQWQDHIVLAGVELRADKQSDLTNYDIDPGYVYFDNTDRQTNIAVYLQDDWHFSPNWHLNLGARIDNSNKYGSHTSPRIGLIWQTSSTLALKALAGIAFRSPIPYESTFGKSPSDSNPALDDEYLSNTMLKEETITTTELVAHWTPSNTFEWVTSIYHYDLEDLITQGTLNGDLQYQQLGNIKSYGIETSTLYKFDSNWTLSANLNLQHSENDQSQHLDNSPVWVTKFLADGPFWQDKLRLALEVHAMGPYTQERYGESIDFSSTVITNTAITALTPIKGLNIQLRIDNLFDRNYVVSGGADSSISRIPADGINASLTLKYRF